MACAVHCALVLARPAPDVDAALRRFARELGLLFQIVDDILDVEGSEADLGKAVGADAARGKVTYVSVHGLEGARRRAGEAHARALAALATMPGPGGGPGRDHRPHLRPPALSGRMARDADAWGLAEGDEIVPGRRAVRLLGGGRRYEAYLAWDDDLYALVVVKVLRPGLVDDARHPGGARGRGGRARPAVAPGDRARLRRRTSTARGPTWCWSSSTARACRPCCAATASWSSSCCRSRSRCARPSTTWVAAASSTSTSSPATSSWPARRGSST